MSVRSARVGHVLRLERRPVAVSPFGSYAEIGVRSFGKGIFHKEPVSGADLGNKRVFEIHPGDLVLSNVFAWEGAVALAGEAERGRIGSHRFMTYVARSGEVDLSYLRYFFISEIGITLLNQASPGSAGRNKTLAIDRFEALEIPLPDIGEQRRVAAKLGRLLSLSDRTAQLFTQSKKLLGTLGDSWLGQTFSALKCSPTRLERIGKVRRGRGPAYELGSGVFALNQACIRWEGLDLGQAREVAATWETSADDTQRIQEDDVLVNSTGEGTIGRCCIGSAAATGMSFDSHVLAVSVDSSVILPEFLVLALRSPQGQQAIEATKGANTTKQTELGKRKLEELEIPVASLDGQHDVIRQFAALETRIRAGLALRLRAGELRAALGASALNRAFAGLL